MYKFQIKIGDASGDGHSYCDIFMVESNLPKDVIEAAYKPACEKLG